MIFRRIITVTWVIINNMLYNKVSCFTTLSSCLEQACKHPIFHATQLAYSEYILLFYILWSETLKIRCVWNCCFDSQSKSNLVYQISKSIVKSNINFYDLFWRRDLYVWNMKNLVRWKQFLLQVCSGKIVMISITINCLEKLNMF